MDGGGEEDTPAAADAASTAAAGASADAAGSLCGSYVEQSVEVKPTQPLARSKVTRRFMRLIVPSTSLRERVGATKRERGGAKVGRGRESEKRQDQQSSQGEEDTVAGKLSIASTSRVLAPLAYPSS